MPKKGAARLSGGFLCKAGVAYCSLFQTACGAGNALRRVWGAARARTGLEGASHECGKFGRLCRGCTFRLHKIEERGDTNKKYVVLTS